MFYKVHYFYMVVLEKFPKNYGIFLPFMELQIMTMTIKIPKKTGSKKPMTKMIALFLFFPKSFLHYDAKIKIYA